MIHLDWTDFPEEFRYLIPAMEVFYKPTVHYRLDPWKLLTDDKIAILAEACKQLAERGDGYLLSKWKKHEAEKLDVSQYARDQWLRNVGMLIASLMGNFTSLAKNGVRPFADHPNVFDDPDFKLDWSKVPEEFSYLIAPAEKYGEIQFDDQIEEFLKNVTSEQRSELAIVANQIKSKDDYKRIGQWLVQTGHVHAEVSRISWMINLLLQLNLPFTTLDWSTLPTELGYLRDPMEHYGEFISDNDDYREIPLPEHLQVELAALGTQIRQHNHAGAIDRWFEQFAPKQYEEAALVKLTLNALKRMKLFP